MLRGKLTLKFKKFNIIKVHFTYCVHVFTLIIAYPVCCGGEVFYTVTKRSKMMKLCYLVPILFGMSFLETKVNSDVWGTLFLNDCPLARTSHVTSHNQKGGWKCVVANRIYGEHDLY